MTHAADTTTRSRRARRSWHDLFDLVDVAFVIALSSLALLGLAPTFTGWSFLVVGVTGVLIGAGVTLLVRTLGWPPIAAVVIALVAFFLLGGPLTLRSQGDSALLPVGSTVSSLADQAIFGWKDMLTTLPPVDGDGPLLVLPWLLGLVGGTLGVMLTRIESGPAPLRAALALLAPAGLLATVILVGVRHPQSLVIQGVAFAVLCLSWLALRAQRASAGVREGTAGARRTLTAVALLAVAGLLAAPVASLFTGGDDERVVLRNYVEPPFDIGRYASPLAAFRRYVDLGDKKRNLDSPTNLYDRELFTVAGPPAGTRVRMATLDHYDGMVWGAANDTVLGVQDDSFQRVSSTIANPIEGEEVEATITLGEGYSGVWLPTIGGLQSMRFETGDPDTKAASFRYNLATSTAVVPSGLHVGDSYSFTAVVPDDSLDAGDGTTGAVGAAAEAAAFLETQAAAWSEGANTPMEQVLAVAAHLRTEGKYSDGVKPNERIYPPGHGVHRLGDQFANSSMIVGNDEQYAAAMALLANRIGVPARVVMGAVIPEGGVVTGRDVSAWVELRAADGTWRTLDTDEFMSDNAPAEQPPQNDQQLTGSVVPPPAPIPPPSTVGEQTDADLKSRKNKRRADEEEDGLLPDVPGWVGFLAKYVGLPLLVVALVLGAIVLAKSIRRRRRRAAERTSARIVGAWRELVDHARDLGQPVPVGAVATRREQSAHITSAEAAQLARKADSHVFGPSDPDAEVASGFWTRIDEERRALSAAVDRRRRWLAAINLTTFRRR